MTASHWTRWARQVGNVAAQTAALAVAILVINSTVVRSTLAQETASLPPPQYSVRDENNVELLSFLVFLQQTDLSIGSKEHPLTHAIFSYSGGDWLSNDQSGSFTPLRFLDKDSYWGRVAQPSPTVTPGNCGQFEPAYFGVTIGNSSETFICLSGPKFQTVSPTGSTLTTISSGGYAYTKRDGEIITFDGVYLRPTQILYPDGRVLTWSYYDDGSGAPQLKSVTRSDGLQLKYTYTQLASGAWSLASVTAINNAYEYCSPTATTCSLQMVWPTVNYSVTSSTSGSVFTVTDAANRVTRYTEDAPTSTAPGRTVGIKLPSSASVDNITYAYCDSRGGWCSNFASAGWSTFSGNFVFSVTRDGQTWNYSGTPGSPTSTQCGTGTYGFTNPVGSGKNVTLYDCPPSIYPPLPTPGQGLLIQLTDEAGVQFNAESNGVQIKNMIKPEGNQTTYSWDPSPAGTTLPGRGNLVQETVVPKPGSPLAQVNLLANYDTTCTIPVKCNKPNWVKDALQNESDYTYDPTHGGVLSATSPADANGIRPQTRYTYVQRYAWLLNSSGAYVKAAAPIWVPATESFCRTSAASPSGVGCTQAGDEVVRTYEYGPDSGPNNLFLRGFSVTADGVTHRTCYGYDRYGNKISQTQPNAALTSCP